MVDTARKPSFNLPLNGYRGICALVVFLYHVGKSGIVRLDEDTGAGFAWSSFRYGVELFFMISGFVITGSLLRHKSTAAFLRDRFVRIFSAWVPSLIVLTAVCLAFKLKMFQDVSALQAAVLFLANLLLLPPLVPVTLVNAASWSLTYEWVFYFAAATGAVLLRRRADARWPMAVWALSVALFIALFPRALFFLPGVIVFSCTSWFERHKRVLQLPWVSLAVFLLAWRCTGADKAELTETLFDWAQDFRWVPATIAFVAAVHMFASITLRATSDFAFLESRAFQFLGKVSYSFYLWHALVIALVKRVIAALLIPKVGPEVGVAAVALVSLAVSLPVSWASWEFLENRLAAWMRKVITPRAAQDQAQAAPVEPRRERTRTPVLDTSSSNTQSL